ncbi:DUF5712 family protein [Xanthocytophaga agilis]|uniref:DUF5712 family protein n=1 Tax=Xanthocytophaga agilis TaxID=3048010 RepID=A0AAE3RCR5_9BACT|nr:DUF5712 family protein [Xanthocytophaga agilis]MDJ1505253.1 DUF5712 family protein [Xanthocytophaga agilis]
MISKVLKAQSGNHLTGKAVSKTGAVYDNKGSSERLVTYMDHEYKQDEYKEHEIATVCGSGQEYSKNGQYFSMDRENLSKKEVIERIDTNVKGLGKEDAKFYSLVISPSQDELAHIGSDAQKLKAYTRQVMENYASEFTLKNGQKLQSKDLVWFGVIHRERQYSGRDKEVREGSARSGQKKQGDQTHIHIIVSRRDSQQKVTLSPTGSRTRFSIKAWQKRNAEDFQRMYDYTRQTHFSKDAYKQAKLQERVEAFSKKHGLDGYLSAGRIALMGKEQDFDRRFYRNLKTLESTLEKGIRPADPYSGLDRKDLYAEFKKLRDYHFDSKAEQKLHRQIVNLRSDYLKQHGVSLSELDLPSHAIRKAYAEHEHKWKFYKNLEALKQTLLQQGHVPVDFEQRLSQKANAEEIAQSQKRSYTRKSFAEQATQEPTYSRHMSKESKQQEKGTGQKRHQTGRERYQKDISAEIISAEIKSDKILSSVATLQKFLSGMSESDFSLDQEWNTRKPKQKKKKTFLTPEQDTGLEW